MHREWDALTYDRISGPQARWAGAVLDRADLAGDERVLDVGCGSGRVTEMLLERVPTGSVVAVDASQEMVDACKARFGQAGRRVEVVLADAAEPIPVAPPVDVVFSTATFHWIHDHDALFANLAGALRRGGRLVAQCGGAGNLARVQRAVTALGQPTDDVYFASPGETVARLEASGFGDCAVWLQPEPTRLGGRAEMTAFLRTVVLRVHVARLGEPDGTAFVDEVAALLGEPELDYVRLNIAARLDRPGAGGWHGGEIAR